MEISSHTNLSFNAQVGKHLLKGVQQQYNGNLQKVDKFVDLFEQTFSNLLDEGTIVDINKENRYVLSHTSFPKIAYMLRYSVLGIKPLAESIITECPKIFGYGERLLFQHITRRSINNVSLNKLEKFVQTEIKTTENQKKFLEVIDLAKRIKEENPDSKLRNIEFEIMDNRVMDEELNTPGTKLYELAHGTISWV